MATYHVHQIKMLAINLIIIKKSMGNLGYEFEIHHQYEFNASDEGMQ